MSDLTLAQALALLADNTTGDISAADMRDIIDALFGRTEGTYALNGLLLDTSPVVPAHTPGHLHWNTDEGTPEVFTDVAGVTLQIGFEQYASVRNNSGSTILNGRPVRLTGATGNKPTIALDNGQGLVLGVATHDIANNSNGKVTTFGLVRDIDTSAFTDGAQVYASSTGTLTTTVTGSRVGFVLLAHVTSGSLFVSPRRNVTASGTTAQRPTVIFTGFVYFDTTLGIPVFWNGAAWVNASGAPA